MGFGSVKQSLGSRLGWWVQQSICLPGLEDQSSRPLLCGLQGGWNILQYVSGQRGRTPGLVCEVCAAVLALHCIQNTGCDAEPFSVTLVVVTVICSLPEVLPVAKHDSKVMQRVSCVLLMMFPCLCRGYKGPWLSSLGAAITPCGAGRAAGAAALPRSWA